MKELTISEAIVDKKIILILFLLFMAFAVFGCKKQEATPTATPAETVPSVTDNLPSSNLTNVDAATIDTIIQQNYNLAKVKAQEWKPDAVLVTISVKFPQDLAVNAADETFIFGSASNSNDWWSFSVSEKTSRYIRAVIPKEDYLGTDVQPINLSYWKLNYGKAFQLTEANGGQAFRSANQNSSVTATLHQTQPRGWLWWEIEYKSSTGKLVIKVNPNTADIVDENGNPLSSGGTSGASNTTSPVATYPAY